MTPEQIDDFEECLRKAVTTLTAIAAGTDNELHEHWRLAGKAQGVKLALSYLEDYR